MAASSNNLATAAQRRAGLATSRLPSAIARNAPVPVTDGASEGVKLVAVPKSASQYIPASSSGGTISMDVVVLSSPSTRTNDTSPGMPPLVTHTFMVVPIHDTPDPPMAVTGVPPANNLVRTEQRISINDKDLVEWDKHNPHMFWIVGTGIMPDQAHLKGQDKRRADRGKYTDCKLPIARGCPIEIQTNAVSKLDGNKSIEVGDILQLSSVNYKIDHSKDAKGNVVRYDNLHAGNIKRIGAWVDVPQMHNDVYFTLFAILPHYMPNFPTLVVNKNWNPGASTGAAAGKDDEAARRAYAEAHGYTYVPPATGAAPAGPEKLKKLSEKSKEVEASLTDTSRSALRHFPYVVPKYVSCQGVDYYLAAHGIKHWKKWDNADPDNMLLEPAHHDSYNYDATDAQAQANADRKEVVYTEQRNGKTAKLVPRMRYAMFVNQALPEATQYWEKTDAATGKPVRAADGAQRVLVTVSNTGAGLYAFGTAEPELMGHVSPVLYSATPAINICYPSNKERIVSSSEAAAASPETERLEYPLGGVVKVSDWKNKGSQPVATSPAVSFFGDLAAGIVSRGYAIDTATADKFIKIKQAMPGVGKTRVSEIMAHSTVKNEYRDENPIGKKNIRSPVQNLFETGINWKDEKDDFQPFIVSNWGLRDFIRSPQIEALYNAMRINKPNTTVLDEKATFERACKFHSALLLDIAENGLPHALSKKERADSQSDAADFERKVNAYAAKIKDWAGLPKDAELPFAPADIPDVFGPMHQLNEENDSNSHVVRPFKFVLFAIRHEYLRDRRMTNYLGDNWYLDVLYELYGAAYKKVVDGIDKGTSQPYSKWLLEGGKQQPPPPPKGDVNMTDAGAGKRKDPPGTDAQQQPQPANPGAPKDDQTTSLPKKKKEDAPAPLPPPPAPTPMADDGGF